MERWKHPFDATKNEQCWWFTYITTNWHINTFTPSKYVVETYEVASHLQTDQSTTNNLYICYIYQHGHSGTYHVSKPRIPKCWAPRCTVAEHIPGSHSVKRHASRMKSSTPIFLEANSLGVQQREFPQWDGCYGSVQKMSGWSTWVPNCTKYRACVNKCVLYKNT